MSNGIRVGSVYFNRKTAMILVACILILTMNIVAFAYIGSQSKNKSKDLIFYSQNPIKIGDFTSGSSIRIRISGAKNSEPFDSLEYKYIPKGYVFFKEYPGSTFIRRQIFGKPIEDNRHGSYQIDFEKYENGEVVSRMIINKYPETNGINVEDSRYYYEGEINSEEIMDSALSGGLEVVSPDLQEFMKRVTDFEEDGIHYYFVSPESGNCAGGNLYWNYDGYLYTLMCYELPLEELTKIAKDVK